MDEAEFGDEFVGEAHGFVGDDAPFDAASVEFGDEFVHAVKEGGVLGVAAVVFVKVFGAPLGVVGMVGGDACAEFEQSCRAVAGLGADFVHAFFGQSVAVEQGIECAPRSRAVSASVPSRSNNTACIMCFPLVFRWGRLKRVSDDLWV